MVIKRVEKQGGSASGNRLALERATKRGDVDLGHAQHRLHGPAGAFSIWTAQQLAELARDDLPRHAEAILAPATLPGRSAAFDQCVPEAVDFRLILAIDDERDRLGERELGTAVEAREAPTGEGEVDRENRPGRSALHGP